MTLCISLLVLCEHSTIAIEGQKYTCLWHLTFLSVELLWTFCNCNWRCHFIFKRQFCYINEIVLCYCGQLQEQCHCIFKRQFCLNLKMTWLTSQRLFIHTLAILWLNIEQWGCIKLQGNIYGLYTFHIYWNNIGLYTVIWIIHYYGLCFCLSFSSLQWIVQVSEFMYDLVVYI